jgi:hypothetical protein
VFVNFKVFVRPVFKTHFFQSDDDEACESPALSADKSAKDCTFEINLLFLQSVNPLLDKIEVQDVLVQCGLNPGKAGRILKSKSEERKEQHAKNGTSSCSSTATTATLSKRVQQSGPSGIPKAQYKENEKIFSNLCKQFAQCDRMFIQQCLVNSKWDEQEAVALIEAGPPIGINSVRQKTMEIWESEHFLLLNCSKQNLFTLKIAIILTESTIQVLYEK